MSEDYPILPNIHFNTNDIPTDDYDMVEWIEEIFPCAEPEAVLWVVRTLLPKSLQILVLEWLMWKEMIDSIDHTRVTFSFCRALRCFTEKILLYTVSSEARHAIGEEPFYVFYFARLIRDQALDCRDYFFTCISGRFTKGMWLSLCEEQYDPEDEDQDHIKWFDFLDVSDDGIKEIYEEYQRVVA